MSANECYKIIYENGVVVPDELNNDEKIGLFVKEILEENPFYQFTINYSITRDFVNSIQDWYIDYNHLLDTRESKSMKSVNDNLVLQHSLVYSNGIWTNTGGDWYENYNNYNCYAYAINRISKLYNPGYYVGNLHPWKDIWTVTVDEIAEIVEDDLYELGYSNISILDSIPLNITPEMNLICLRKGYTDYHFMKYDYFSKAWYHKPSQNAILKYNEDLIETNIWDNEASCRGKIIERSQHDASIHIYDSDIKFIVYYDNTVNLNCRSELFQESVHLKGNASLVKKVNIECNKNYSIDIPESSLLNVQIYDFVLNYSIYTNCNVENSTFKNYLNAGTYILNVENPKSSSEENLYINYKATWSNNGYEIYYNNENNILAHLHRSNTGNLENVLYYINTIGTGIYKFTLTATKTDGSAVIYPARAITIKDENDEEIIDKFSLNEYSSSAQSLENVNSMYVQLSRNGYFYIHIQMPDGDYESVTLNITPVNLQQIDVFTSQDLIVNEEINIFNNSNEKNDSIKKVKLNQTGKFNLNASYTGTQENNLIFILAKEVHDSQKHTYSIVSKYVNILNSNSNIIDIVIDLEEGTYYIGYFNMEVGIIDNIKLTRLVSNSENINKGLIPDPDSGTLCGSQINIMEKDIIWYDRSYRRTNITEGFTRNIYLDRIYAPSVSRLDYNWYSSNEYIATVTEFGTVLGKTPGIVSIMAVYIDNLSIFFIQTFSIINDTNVENVTLDIYQIHSLSVDGDYQIKLTTQNSPYNWIQYYIWNVEVVTQEKDLLVSLDGWGNLTTNGTGEVVLIGEYTLNSRFTVVIHLSIIE